jgi:hypothetical protein
MEYVLLIMGIGKMESEMEKEHKLILINQLMKEILKMEKDMEREECLGLMDHIT